jgi:hypothetical protein
MRAPAIATSAARPRAHDPWQALRTARSGDETEGDLGQPEDRALGRDAEVTSQGDLEPHPQGETVHGRDHRLRQLLQKGGGEALEKSLAESCGVQPRPLLQHPDVGAAHEVITSAPEDHDPHVWILPQLLRRLPELGRHHRVERVQDLRTVEHQARDAVVDG